MVTRTQALSASQTIHIVARATDQGPLLLPVGGQSVNEGQPLHLALSALDAAGDSLLYQATNLPAGAKFDPVAGVLDWTPLPGQAGTYNVHFSTSDGFLSSGEDVTLTVNHVNQPPLLAAILPQFTQEGQDLGFALAALRLTSNNLHR